MYTPTFHIPTLSATKLAPFAVALAEDVRERQERLDYLKAVRRKQESKTAQDYVFAMNAYATAKRHLRESLAAYNAARAKAFKGDDPGQLDEETAERLALHCWCFDRP